MHIWEQLFSCALKLLANTPITASQWRFGGGTVLMLRHEHRLSNDIDIFFSDPQLRGYVSPRLNEALDDDLGDYLEADFYTRIVLKSGKIDFITAPPVTSGAPETRRLCGVDVYLDPSAEIIGKKIKYRGGEFKSRDVLDLAVVLQNEGEMELMAFSGSIPTRQEKPLK